MNTHKPVVLKRITPMETSLKYFFELFIKLLKLDGVLGKSEGLTLRGLNASKRHIFQESLRSPKGKIQRSQWFQSWPGPTAGPTARLGHWQALRSASDLEQVPNM